MRFLQLHTLTSYPGTLLNRDDAGFAKRLPFGDTPRTRVSSQCLKRHWRTYDGPHSLRRLGVDMSVRSRHTFERHVIEPLVTEGVDRSVARSVVGKLANLVLGQSDKAAKAADGASRKDGALQTSQITVLGRPEIDYLLSEAREACGRIAEGATPEDAIKWNREDKKNLRALRCAAGLDAALFGRMVTGDELARGDAAVHVAHAITVHEQATESDYFSAVDDLIADDGALGSGHINSTELTSGLFYGYVVVDVPLLVSNIEGCKRAAWREVDRGLAGDVLRSFVQIVATTSPGAKRGSTAPYAYASMVAAEWGDAQPRTWANAFVRAVRMRPNVLDNTYDALSGHVGDLDRMYGPVPNRCLAAMGSRDRLTLEGVNVDSVAEVADWAASRLREG